MDRLSVHHNGGGISKPCHGGGKGGGGGGSMGEAKGEHWDSYILVYPDAVAARLSRTNSSISGK